MAMSATRSRNTSVAPYWTRSVCLFLREQPAGQVLALDAFVISGAKFVHAYQIFWMIVVHGQKAAGFAHGAHFEHGRNFSRFLKSFDCARNFGISGQARFLGQPQRGQSEYRNKNKK